MAIGRPNRPGELRSTPWRGRGWRFPILPDARGALAYTEGEENIVQSVRIALLTRLGERVMRADFGCRAGHMVFAPGSLQNLRLIEVSVRDGLLEWEPRIVVDEIRAEAQPGAENHVTVDIDFRIRSTNSRHNLVFPFYLGKITRP
jgi:phage baseplate assembly protein W